MALTITNITPPNTLDATVWLPRVTKMRAMAAHLFPRSSQLYDELRGLELALSRIIAQPLAERLFVQAVIEEVCQTHCVDRLHLFSKNRSQKVANARAVLCYLLYEHTMMSFPDIGNLLGRDHSSVIHAYRLIQRRMQEPMFAKTVNQLLSVIVPVYASKEKSDAEQTHDRRGTLNLSAGGKIDDLPDTGQRATTGL